MCVCVFLFHLKYTGCRLVDLVDGGRARCNCNGHNLFINCRVVCCQQSAEVVERGVCVYVFVRIDRNISRTE